MQVKVPPNAALVLDLDSKTMPENLKQFKLRGEEVMPVFSTSTIERAVLLSSVAFLMSLFLGVANKSLGFLAEALLILVFSWGIYRRNYAAAVLLSVYLLLVKTYQLIFLTDLPVVFRFIGISLAILFARRFYLGSKDTMKKDLSTGRMLGTLDIVFILTISLMSISVSAFAIEWYG